MTKYYLYFSYLRYFDYIDDPLHEDFLEIYTIATYLSPFHQITLTKSEKTQAKEAIKTKLSLMWVQSSGGQQQDAARVEVPAQQVPDIMLPGRYFQHMAIFQFHFHISFGKMMSNNVSRNGPCTRHDREWRGRKC